MDFINSLIDNYNFPILTAFLLGVLTSISPCPLATNITAIAYISKEVKTAKHTLLNGIFYTFGRSLSYTTLTTVIYFGFSTFQISSIFQGWGDKILGPVLVIVGSVMFGAIKINLGKGGKKIEKIKFWLTKKGFVGSFLLGALFALAFCPYSGVLFFGALIPLVIKSQESLILPPFFAFGTGLPVIIFSFIIAFAIQKLGQIFKIMQKIEKVMRCFVATIFIGVGIYYLQFLINYIVLLIK